jgi:hypothetical protein
VAGRFLLPHNNNHQGRTMPEISNTDIGRLLADVEHIKELVGECNKKLDEMNGNLDTTITDVAVLKDWRQSHEEKHGWGNSLLTMLAAAALAAWQAVNK